MGGEYGTHGVNYNNMQEWKIQAKLGTQHYYEAFK
jgi:hypothetical protein